jgi:two-component system chemotaxis response regulator CheB
MILSGALDDGTAGLLAIRAASGLAVVQDPDEALVAAMPQNAANVVGADRVARAAEIPRLLIEFNQHPVLEGQGADPMDPIERMEKIVDQDMVRQAQNDRVGQVSVFTCPECGGALWQVAEKELVRFRCHVGHAYGAEVLLAEQTEALEAALWTAVRTFKEKWVLARQLANQERTPGNKHASDRFVEQAAQAARFGEVIQGLLHSNGVPQDSMRDSAAVRSSKP